MKKYILAAGLALGSVGIITTTTQSCMTIATTVGLSVLKKILIGGVSKGLGILKLKELMHLEEVAGIGDSYNDIPMLETVDHSFTFPTSPESLTSIVDDVVDSVEEALDILMKE